MNNTRFLPRLGAAFLAVALVSVPVRADESFA